MSIWNVLEEMYGYLLPLALFKRKFQNEKYTKEEALTDSKGDNDPDDDVLVPCLNNEGPSKPINI